MFEGEGERGPKPEDEVKKQHAEFEKNLVELD